MRVLIHLGKGHQFSNQLVKVSHDSHESHDSHDSHDSHESHESHDSIAGEIKLNKKYQPKAG